ncbi:MAG: CBS domain-containing protein [Acidobacteriota bacterium]
MADAKDRRARMRRQPRLIPVHVRAHGSDARDVDSAIPCPREAGRDVTIDTCTACASFSGMSLDTEGRRSYVVCSHASDPAPVRAPATAEPLPRAARTPVSRIMTRAVVCVPSSLTVSVLETLLTEKRISGVPVVDAEGRPIGIASKTDLVRMRSEASDVARRRKTRTGKAAASVPAARTVRDVMTPIALTISEGTSVAEAAGVMNQEGLHRLPVVDADGKIVGILSAMDLLRFAALHSD